MHHKRLESTLALHSFRQAETAQPVNKFIREIGGTFATDHYDDGRFMIWHDEQRAIAEKMQVGGKSACGIGYATFVERYDSTFVKWFCSFDQDLAVGTAALSRRFEVLQYRLARLGCQIYQKKMHTAKWRSLMGGARDDLSDESATDRQR